MAAEEAGRSLTNAKKRRGVARASLTRLTNRLKDLEGESAEHKTLELTQRMSQKLSDLDSEFRTHHHALIDLIDDEDALAEEQEVLDTHDDLVAELSVRVKQVIVASSPSTSESSCRISSRKLAHLQKSLTTITSIIRDTSTTLSDTSIIRDTSTTLSDTSIIRDTSTTLSDTCLLRQYEEMTNGINRYLVKTRDDLHRLELDEIDELFELQDRLETPVFYCFVNFKKLLCSASGLPGASYLQLGVKGLNSLN